MPLSLEHDPVVEVPVVGAVLRIGAVAGLPLRDADSPAPVQVHAEQVDTELLERRKEVRRLPVVGTAAVGDAAAQTGCGRSRRHAQECQRRDRGDPEEPTPHGRSIGCSCAKRRGFRKELRHAQGRHAAFASTRTRRRHSVAHAVRSTRNACCGRRAGRGARRPQGLPRRDLRRRNRAPPRGRRGHGQDDALVRRRGRCEGTRSAGPARASGGERDRAVVRGARRSSRSRPRRRARCARPGTAARPLPRTRPRRRGRPRAGSACRGGCGAERPAGRERRAAAARRSRRRSMARRCVGRRDRLRGATTSGRARRPLARSSPVAGKHCRSRDPTQPAGGAGPHGRGRAPRPRVAARGRPRAPRPRRAAPAPGGGPPGVRGQSLLRARDRPHAETRRGDRRGGAAAAGARVAPRARSGETRGAHAREP